MKAYTNALNMVNRPVAIILDDHTLYSEAFASLIEKSSFFQGVYTFAHTEPLMDFILNLKEQREVYLYIDYFLEQGQTTLPVINDLKRFYKPLKTIMVSSVTNPLIINNILTYRIDGFLSKSSGTEEIFACIREIGNKRQFISPYIRQIIERFETGSSIPFSAREIEILAYFSQGLTVNATAERMQLSRHTISSHRRRMMAKSETKSITELLAFARKLELI